MANVAIFKNGEKPKYLRSVNTPDYEGDYDVLINPDISSVAGVPLKYWKRNVDSIEEMTISEKSDVDAAELVAKKGLADTYSVGTITLLTALIKVINVRIPGNPITKQEMVTALKAEIT